MNPRATSPDSSSKQHGRLPVCLLLLLAFGIRLLYVPLHLAHEEHLGPGGHLILAHSAHVESGAELQGHDHAHDSSLEHEHGHEDGHAPHSALDHALELLLQNVSSRPVLDDVAWALPDGELELLSRRAGQLVECLAPRAPEERGRAPGRPRGPPASV